MADETRRDGGTKPWPHVGITPDILPDSQREAFDMRYSASPEQQAPV